MYSLIHIAGKLEGGKNFYELLDKTEDGKLPLANIAQFLIAIKYPAASIIASQRQENFETITRAVSYICGTLDAYLRAIEEGKGSAQPEWPVDQVQYLLAVAQSNYELLDAGLATSLSQETIDEVEKTPELLEVLKELAQDEYKEKRIPIPPTDEEWIFTPEPYWWLEQRYLVGVANSRHVFLIGISPKGKATYLAAMAQKLTKDAHLPQ